MKARRLFLGGVILILSTVFSACSKNSSEMQNGYYTAEAVSFDMHGWKDYVTIYVSDNKIVTVEYNAFNVSGFIKSWDLDYMRIMNTKVGTYPSEYVREYTNALINRQDPAVIDAMSGATTSHAAFQMLVEAAVAKAKEGDKQVALVELPESNIENEG